MPRVHPVASLLGLLLFAAALILLGLTGGSRSAPPLEVVLESAPPRLSAQVKANRPVQLQVASRRYPPRGPVEAGQLPPGLHTATWSVRYAGKPPLSTSKSFLCGAPAPDGWLPGAARLTLSQALFDDGQGGGLAAALSPLLAAELKRNAALERWVGAVTQVRFGLRVLDGALALSLVAELQSDEARAQLQLATRLAVHLRAGRLELAAQGPPAARIVGDYRSSLAQAVVQALDLLLDVNVVDRQVSRQADQLLAHLLPLLSAALSQLLFSELTVALPELPLRLRWRPAQLALEEQTALHLLFDVTLELAGDSRPDPKRAQRLPALGGPLPCRPVAGERSESGRLELSADLFNRASQLLWQHRLLDQQLNRLDPARSLTPRRLRRLLSFAIEGFDFGLPPTLMQWQPAGAQLAIGELGARLRPLAEDSDLPKHVWLHGRSRLLPRLDKSGQRLILSARTAPLAISCGDGSHRRPLRPCLTALSGVANELLAQAPPSRLIIPLAPLFARSTHRLGQHELTLQVQPQAVALVSEPVPVLRAELGLSVRVKRPTSCRFRKGESWR